MNIRTIESDFEYQMNQMLKKYKEYKGIDDSEIVTDIMLWNDKKIIGEIMYDLIFEVVGFESIGVKEVE